MVRGLEELAGEPTRLDFRYFHFTDRLINALGPPTMLLAAYAIDGGSVVVFTELVRALLGTQVASDRSSLPSLGAPYY